MAKTENPKQRVAKRIKGLANMARKSTIIKEEYYEQHDCKRGLRDLNGKGVVVGLTEISEIIASKVNEQGVREPCNGELYYRGILLDDIVKGFIRENLSAKNVSASKKSPIFCFSVNCPTPKNFRLSTTCSRSSELYLRAFCATS